MSTISWFSIFSGFSAREIRSLMFDRISVDRRSKIPMGSLVKSNRSASASGRLEPLGVARLGQQPLHEIHPFHQFGDFPAHLLQFGAQFLLHPRVRRRRRPSFDALAERPPDRRYREQEQRPPTKEEDDRQ